MVKIEKLICYECDYCGEYINKNSDFMIRVSGQWEGRSDMPFEFHFCDIQCLRDEYKKEKKIDKARKNCEDDEYVWVLQRELAQLNFKEKYL